MKTGKAQEYDPEQRHKGKVSTSGDAVTETRGLEEDPPTVLDGIGNTAGEGERVIRQGAGAS